MSCSMLLPFSFHSNSSSTYLFLNLHHMELHLNMGLNMGGEGSLHRWSLVNVFLDASPVVHWLQRLWPLPSRCCDWWCCFRVWHLQHLMSLQVQHGQYHIPLNILGVRVRRRPSAVCYWAGSVQFICLRALELKMSAVNLLSNHNNQLNETKALC